MPPRAIKNGLHLIEKKRFKIGTCRETGTEVKKGLQVIEKDKEPWRVIITACLLNHHFFSGNFYLTIKILIQRTNIYGITQKYALGVTFTC